MKPAAIKRLRVADGILGILLRHALAFAEIRSGMADENRQNAKCRLPLRFSVSVSRRQSRRKSRHRSSASVASPSSRISRIPRIFASFRIFGAIMDREQFRKAGYAAIDRVCDYFESIENDPVMPQIQPGSIAKLIAEDPPAQGEVWSAVEADFDRVILPGITAWQHPSFFAYFPGSSNFVVLTKSLPISRYSQHDVRIDSRRHLRRSSIESRVQLGVFAVVHRIGGA